MQYINTGADYEHVKRQGLELSALSVQLFYETKIALKNKVCSFKNKISIIYPIFWSKKLSVMCETWSEGKPKSLLKMIHEETYPPIHPSIHLSTHILTHNFIYLFTNLVNSNATEQHLNIGHNVIRQEIFMKCLWYSKHYSKILCTIVSKDKISFPQKIHSLVKRQWIKNNFGNILGE